ncbi:MAG TPA: hypothetical protein VK821_15235 [Dehalococcoidia bacterium]|nr:hypothetical protein [Dehalococcoidia bacterium]
MANERRRVDVRDMTETPAWVDLLEDVKMTRRPAIIRADGEDIAEIRPIGRRRATGIRAKTKADHEAFLASAGGWKDIVDTDKFLADNEESRRLSSRPPVEL